MRAIAAAAASVVVATSTTACRRDPMLERVPAVEAGDVRTRAELPVPRTEIAGAAMGGRIVVVGGLTADGAASARVDVYHPATDSWSAGPGLPTPAHHVGMTAAVGRVWVAGGFTNETGQPWRELRDVWSLGEGETAWRREPPLLGPRGALGLASTGDALVAFGGVRNGGVVDSTEVLRGTAATEWVPGPPLAEAREHLGATTIGTRVFAIAGRVGSLESNKRTVESWDAREPAWRREPSLRETRGGTAGASSCVAGGEEPGATIASVECLQAGKWVTIASLRRPRHGLAVVAFANDLHVIGGGEQPGLFVSGAHEVVRLPRERAGG